jgi:hypothetical protein
VPEIDLGQESSFQLFQLHEIDLALEYRLLYALSASFADFGDASQPAPAFTGLRVHVVADDHQHVFTSR